MTVDIESVILNCVINDWITVREILAHLSDGNMGTNRVIVSRRLKKLFNMGWLMTRRSTAPYGTGGWIIYYKATDLAKEVLMKKIAK